MPKALLCKPFLSLKSLSSTVEPFPKKTICKWEGSVCWYRVSISTKSDANRKYWCIKDNVFIFYTYIISRVFGCCFFYFCFCFFFNSLVVTILNFSTYFIFSNVIIFCNILSLLNFMCCHQMIFFTNQNSCPYGTVILR